MRDYETNHRRESTETMSDRFNSFTRWLSRRPMESWMFFIAGLIIARILF